MTFTWDPLKAALNMRKHGVGFREAATVLGDPLSTTFPDDAHSVGERRFVTIGRSAAGRILVVVHADEVAVGIRLLSARPATRRERKYYEEE